MVRVMYIGGPTALLETGGIRFLTDPGFDPAGTEFQFGSYALTRTQSPAILREDLPLVHVVLLSDDHHRDNIDESGRALLPKANRVLTTEDGATRLAGNASGLLPGESTIISGVKITATPARHGSKGGDRGPVIGFMLESPDEQGATYICGDTVLYDGLIDVVAKFDVRRALLFLGAARIAAIGPAYLTMTAQEAIELAGHMPRAKVMPLHFKGWAHFTEGRNAIEQSFANAGLSHALLFGEAAKPIDFS